MRRGAAPAGGAARPRRGVGVSRPSARSPPPDVEQDDPTSGAGAAPVASSSPSPCPWARGR
jgi:hypothetical protein